MVKQVNITLLTIMECDDQTQRNKIHKMFLFVQLFSDILDQANPLDHVMLYP